MAMRPLAEAHPISQRYRDNSTAYNLGAGHGAIDIAAPIGSTVVAPEDGTVVFDGWVWDLSGGPNDWAARWYLIKPARGDTRGGGGICTIIRNSAGSHWGMFHASQSFMYPGQKVKKGQRIQLSGDTGIATGPHSHINLWPARPNWQNGFFGAIDPEPYLTERFAPLDPANPPKTTPTRYLNGIDVSAYQPADIVRRVPADFVIVKATESSGWVNGHAKQQLQDAHHRGKKLGVYHFGRPLHNDSRVEADHFVKFVKSLGVPLEKLFWVLDWEEEEAFGYNEWAADFMARVDESVGTRCGLYTTTRGMTSGTWSVKDRQRPLWRAIPVMSGQPYATEFRLSAPPAGWTNLVLDQYSFFGRLPGYAADLDLNVYYGGIPQWGATGGGAATTKKFDLLEWLTMASQKEINAALNAWATSAAGKAAIGSAVLDRQFTDSFGRKISLAYVLKYDKQNWDLVRDVLDALSPKALVNAVLGYVNPSEKKADPRTPDFYGRVTQIWKAVTAKPTTGSTATGEKKEN